MEKSVESSIDLTAIFRLLLKKLWMLLLIGVVAGIIGFGISAFLLTPQYRSAATLYVASSQSDANANKTTSDIAVAIRLANSYKEIFVSRTVLQQVESDFNGKYTIQQLSGMVSVENSDDSEILTLQVTCPAPSDAQRIAEKIFDYGTDEIMRVIRAGWVEYIDKPSLPQQPVSPNVLQNTLLAFIIGFVLCAVVLIVHDLINDKLKGQEDLTEAFPNVPIVGLIPKMRERRT